MSGLSSLSSTLTSAVNDTQAKINTTQTQLASNKKTLDPAQQGVVTRLSAQVAGYSAAKSNITQAQSVISVAQSGLSAISDMLTQMQSMATKASTAGVTASDAASYQATFKSLADQIQNLAKSSSVNGASALGTTNLTIQTGLDEKAATSQTTVVAVNVSNLGSNPANGTGPNISAPLATTDLIAAGSTVIHGNGTTEVTTVARMATADDKALITNSSSITAVAAGTVIASGATVIHKNGTTDTTTTLAAAGDSIVAGGLSLTTAAGAQAALQALALDLATVSAGQSTLSASAVGLTAQGSMADNLGTNLQNTIDSIQKPDQAALQIQLSQLNNQSTVDFYLISQMNTASQGVLSLFR